MELLTTDSDDEARRIAANLNRENTRRQKMQEKVLAEARELLAHARVNFCGNAEGRDLFNGRFDVLVCDGFVGNIILKCVEGMAGSMLQTITQELKTLEPAIQAKLAPVLADLQRRHDAEEYGGAPLLGVDGIVIICHGNARARAIANALKAAATYARQQVNRVIIEEVAQAGGAVA